MCADLFDLVKKPFEDALNMAELSRVRPRNNKKNIFFSF